MGPFDYSSAFADVGSAYDATMKGYGDGLKLKQIEAEQAAAQLKAKQQAQMQAELTAASQNPTTEGIIALSVKFPALAENLKRSFDMLDPQEQKAKISQGLPVYTALKNKQPEIARKVLLEQAAAYRNSGDENEAKAAEAYARQIEENPGAAQVTLGGMLASVIGADKFAKMESDQGQEARAAELQPDLVRKGAAAADQAKSDAQKAASEATLTGERAKVAPQLAKAEIDKLAADLKLTKAQTSSALAQAANLSAQTKKTILETESLKNNGGVDPEKRFKLESDLRKECATQTKNFTDVKEAYARIVNSENTGAGDIALVYSYMKILDPTSVVREGEFATAQNSAGIPAAVVAAYNKALNGERLTKTQRENFVSQGKKLVNAAGVREKEVRKGIDTIAGNYRLDKNNIYFNEANVDPVPPAGNLPAGWKVQVR